MATIGKYNSKNRKTFREHKYSCGSTGFIEKVMKEKNKMV